MHAVDELDWDRLGPRGFGRADHRRPRPLEAVAAVWRQGGWAAEVSRDGIVAPYNAPGTGPPRWQVYRVAAHTVLGVATAEPYGATRWQF